MQPRLFHIGAQNDQLYIVSGKAPALNNDYPVHDADRTCVAKVWDAEEAQRLVRLANAAIEGIAPGAGTSRPGRVGKGKQSWLDEAIDWDLKGHPISRRLAIKLQCGDLALAYVEAAIEATSGMAPEVQAVHEQSSL